MIQFKGKNKITGTWVYGDLYQHENQTFIMEHCNRVTEVHRHTVAQSSGVDDIWVDCFPQIDIDTDFHEGEIILYQNGSNFEVGKIKRLTNKGAFVYYHEGDTASFTPFDCMRKVLNARTIKTTSLGEASEANSDSVVCPKCGNTALTLFESLDFSHEIQCIDCMLKSRY